MDFTQEQIENIWKRVLADMDDPAGAFDPLMLAGGGGENTAPDARTGPEYQDDCYDYREGYNVYTDIERSVYGSPNASGTAAGNTGGDFLREHIPKLIAEQLGQSRLCRSLSHTAPNRRSSRVLTLIANRDYSSAKSISSAYFLQSGNYCFPRSDRRPENVPYYRSSLRTAWKNEVSLTALCTSASEKTEDVPLIKVLLDGARGHAANAVELRRLIEQSLD